MSELSRWRGSEGYGACFDDMPVGTPVDAHERGAGSVERRKIKTVFLRSAFSKLPSGKREDMYAYPKPERVFTTL